MRLVRDDEGRVLVVYRGEHGAIGGEIVAQTRLPSISFGSANAANIYACSPNDRNDLLEAPRVIPCVLSMEKSLECCSDDPFIDVRYLASVLGEVEARRIAIKFADRIANTGIWVDDFAERNPDCSSFLSACDCEVLYGFYFEMWPYLDDPEEVEKLFALGFDGAIYGGSGENAHEREYRVFSANQVYSAISGELISPALRSHEVLEKEMMVRRELELLHNLESNFKRNAQERCRCN